MNNVLHSSKQAVLLTLVVFPSVDGDNGYGYGDDGYGDDGYGDDSYGDDALEGKGSKSKGSKGERRLTQPQCKF
jgi:hypothetical protein